MKIIENRTIEGEYITINGVHFIDCTLIRCILRCAGEDVVFERTVLRWCRYVFYGQALKTVHFLQETGLVPHDPAYWKEFSEAVH